MRRLPMAFLLLGASLPAAAAPVPSMDAARGRELFQSRGCVECHKLNGRGGSAAPDLGRIVDRGFTPALLAATMWNHAPVMWSAMRARNVAPMPLSEQDAADLFAAFYAAHYFDLPADASRGKAVFARAACARCHGLETSPVAAAPPVRNWASLSDSVSLVATMWDHAAKMQGELAKEKIAWPKLTGADVADLLVYLRNQPAVPRTRKTTFSIAAGDNGQRLFVDKGCGKACHISTELNTRRHDARRRGGDAVESCEPAHDPAGVRPQRDERVARLCVDAAVLSGCGKRGAGREGFRRPALCAMPWGERKRCAGPGGPRRDGWDTPSFPALWRHGPTMLDQMKSKGIPWPEFRAGEMADLIAYVNAGKK